MDSHDSPVHGTARHTTTYMSGALSESQVRHAVQVVSFDGPVPQVCILTARLSSACMRVRSSPFRLQLPVLSYEGATELSIVRAEHECMHDFAVGRPVLDHSLVCNAARRDRPRE